MIHLTYERCVFRMNMNIPTNKVCLQWLSLDANIKLDFFLFMLFIICFGLCMVSFLFHSSSKQALYKSKESENIYNIYYRTEYHCKISICKNHKKRMGGLDKYSNRFYSPFFKPTKFVMFCTNEKLEMVD